MISRQTILFSAAFLLIGLPAAAQSTSRQAPPNPFLGSVVKGAATAEELMAFVAERVAPYKKIRRVEFIAAIPKSPSGKILRRLLRDLPTGSSLLPS